MELDKLKFKAQLQSEFENSSDKEIKLAIRISTVMTYLYSKFISSLFILLLSIIPLYLMGLLNTTTMMIAIVISFIVTEVLFRFFFSDFHSTRKEFEYTIEVLHEMLNERKKQKG